MEIKDNTQTRCRLQCVCSNHCLVHYSTRNYTWKKLTRYRLKSRWFHDQSLKKCEPYKRHITLVSIHTAFELNSSDQTVTIAYMTLNIAILRINQRCRQYFGLWKQHHLNFHEPSSSSNMLYMVCTENDNVNSLPLQGMWVFFST